MKASPYYEVYLSSRKLPTFGEFNWGFLPIKQVGDTSYRKAPILGKFRGSSQAACALHSLHEFLLWIRAYRKYPIRVYTHISSLLAMVSNPLKAENTQEQELCEKIQELAKDHEIELIYACKMHTNKYARLDQILRSKDEDSDVKYPVVIYLGTCYDAVKRRGRWALHVYSSDNPKCVFTVSSLEDVFCPDRDTIHIAGIAGALAYITSNEYISRASVHIDDYLALIGVKDHLKVWKKRKWKLQSGNPVRNVQLWRRILELQNKCKCGIRYVEYSPRLDTGKYMREACLTARRLLD